MTITRKIFLASSAELKDDRDEFEIFVNRKNKDWVNKGVFLELVLWEDFLDAVSPTRLQDHYNQAIRECDLFVMLFFTKVGRYTEEEFETAFGQFEATHKPFIFTYFKNAPHTASRADQQSLWAFQDKLKALGHFQTEYTNAAELKLHFSQQLDKLVANGFIQFKPAQETTAASAGSSYQATLTRQRRHRARHRRDGRCCRRRFCGRQRTRAPSTPAPGSATTSCTARRTWATGFWTTRSWATRPASQIRRKRS
jgi:hypothetical protein